MPRKQKMETEQMLQIVDDYFSTEAAGDPDRLKCSLLEKFAVRNGFPLKAYDFRRNAAVRVHMETLKQLAREENGVRLLAGHSYKSLDIEKILKVHGRPDNLRKVLGRLDDYWKQVYDESLQILQKNAELSDTVQVQKTDLEASAKRAEKFQRQAAAADQERRRLLSENRHLRKILRTHLYPAAAEQILREENLLDKSGSEQKDTLAAGFCDSDTPFSFTESVAADRKNRTELLLERMRAESEGDAV